MPEVWVAEVYVIINLFFLFSFFGKENKTQSNNRNMNPEINVKGITPVNSVNNKPNTVAGSPNAMLQRTILLSRKFNFQYSHDVIDFYGMITFSNCSESSSGNNG